MLDCPDTWRNREMIVDHLKEMVSDPIVETVLLRAGKHLRNERRKFYETIRALAEAEE